MFYISQILELWLKNVPDWTAIFCVLMMTSTLVDQLTVFLYQSLQAQGDIKCYSFVKGIINVLPIAVSILMFSLLDFPPYWALINMIIGKGIFGGLINLYFCRRNIALSYGNFISKVLVRCMAIVLCCVFLDLLLRPIPVHWLLGFVLCVVLSLPCYWFIGLNKEERLLTINFIRNK